MRLWDAMPIIHVLLFDFLPFSGVYILQMSYFSHHYYLFLKGINHLWIK